MATHDPNPALQSLRELPAPAKNATEMSQSGISQPTSGNGEHDLVIEIPDAVESIPRHSAHPNESGRSPQSLNHDVYELAENVGIIDVSIDSRMKDRLTDLDASPLEVHAALRKPLASKTARFVFWAGHESSIFRLLLDLFPLNSKSGSVPNERRVVVVGGVTSVAALRAIYQGTEDDVYIIQCVGGRWRYSFDVIMFVLPHDSLLFCFTGSYEFGRIDLNRVLFDKFLSDTSYINTANGDRRQFIHLFVLDLLSAIFHILRGRVEKLLRVEDRTWVTLPSLDEPDWTRNTRRMLRKNVEINDEPYSVRLIHNFDGLNMYENVLSNARAMERAFKYLHESVGANSGPLLQSPFKVSALELEEYCECAQRLVSYKSRAIEFDKNGIEIEGSESVRRLTTLATIFLPLSLSSSILAMGSRVSELHYRIYDFFGLFCVLGTLMILGYPILRWATKRKGWNLARPCSRVYILKIIIVFHLRCAGFLILVSFLVGMSKDANLGLKIPGYGMSATLGVFILAIFAHFMYAAVPIILYKEPPANNSGQDHSIPPIIIGKSLMIFFGWFLNPR